MIGAFACTVFLIESNASPVSGDVLNPGTDNGSRWMVGISGGANYVWFTPGPHPFTFPDPYKVVHPQLFSRGLQTGNGLGYMTGFTLDLVTSSGMDFFANFEYISRTAIFTPQNTDTFWSPPASAFIPTTVQDRLALTIAFGNIQLGMRYFFVPHSWYAFAGVGASVTTFPEKSYTLEEHIVSPSTAVYVNDSTGATWRALKSQGTIANNVLGQIEVMVGAGTMIPIEDKVYMVPEVFLVMPTQRIIEGANYYAITIGFSTSFKVEL